VGPGEMLGLPKNSSTRLSQLQAFWRMFSMKIRPLYDRIVVKRIEQKEQMHGGLYIPDSAKEKPQEGEVVAVGKGKRLEDGKVIPLDVQPGDRILFGKYSGSDIKLDNDEYLIMREDEVLGILDAQPQATKKAS
jgi:chaperonin GroES